jgi:hypothetical protein
VTSLRRKIVLAAVLVCLLGFAAIVALVVFTVHSGIPSVDCGESAPFAEPRYPGHAVFVAKVLYSTGGDWRPPERYTPWAIAVVQHRYWGLPWWTPNVVLIGHGYLKNGEQYFVDGNRATYRISKFLPYIDFRCGNRTRPLKEADLDLRVLREGPPNSSARIIGPAYRRDETGRLKLAAGIGVEAMGPAGTVASVSDQQGIYDFTGLPPGQYTIRVAPEEEDPFDQEFPNRRPIDLKIGDVWGRAVYAKR